MKNIYIRTVNSNMIRLFQIVFFKTVLSIGHNGSYFNGKKGFYISLKKRSNTAL
jgi:hypothetical protein